MTIVEIRLILQRPATREELRAYEVLQTKFNAMRTEERAARGVVRVTDLASTGDPAAHVIHYNTSSEPLTNEIYVEYGRLQVGVPGAIDRLKQVVAHSLRTHRRACHQSFYVVGLLEARDGRKVGFRTLIARSALPVRNVGHRNSADSGSRR